MDIKSYRYTVRRAAALTLAFFITFLSATAAFAFPAVSAGAVERASGSNITISDANYPAGNITLGVSFGIRGVISSNYALSKVWGGVYYTNGSPTAQFREVSAGSKTFDLRKGIDAYIVFSKLLAGDYLFRIYASDNTGYTKTLIDSRFTVVDNGSIPSAIELTGESLPADVLLKGGVFSVRGLVSSSYAIRRIWGGVYDSAEKATSQYFDDSPYKASYDLNANFDKRLSFGSLGAGSYIYKIEAEDIRGYSVVLVKKSFTISDSGSVPSDIAVYGATYPTGVLPQGSAFGIAGTIYSTYVLTTVKGGIYKSDGKPTEQVYIYNPNKKSFSLSEMDKNLVFGKIPEGDYIYRIQAVDSKGYAETVIDSRFAVRSVGRTAGSAPIVMKGIDISSYQNSINWSKVAASGLDFAIIRAASTNNADVNYMEDRYFSLNYTKARAAGLKVGAYIYTSAYNKSEMKYNIDCLLRTLDGRSLDMPVYIDVEAEKRQTPLGKAALTEVVLYGCSLIKAAGYQAGVYANLTWYKKYLDADMLCAGDNEIWLAAWPDNPDKYDYSDLCVTWQYTSSGKVDGIDGNVDMDYRYKEIIEKKYAVTVGDIVNGTVTCGVDKAKAGDKVTLTVTPNKGYSIKSVKYNDMEASRDGDNIYSFTMPSNDVTVTAVFEKIILRGDVNGDGTVDPRDLIRMMKYLSGEDVEVAEENLDVNGDGSVNSADLVRLMKNISDEGEPEAA